jgi:hypothetical protein
VRHVHLWPRFHVKVREALGRHNAREPLEVKLWACEKSGRPNVEEASLSAAVKKEAPPLKKPADAAAAAAPLAPTTPWRRRRRYRHRLRQLHRRRRERLQAFASSLDDVGQPLQLLAQHGRGARTPA